MSADRTGAYTTAAWQVVLHNAVQKARAEMPCWCGHPFAGHGGWLLCAEREAARLTPDKTEYGTGGAA